MPDYKVVERIALLNHSERKAFRRKLRDTGNIQQFRLFEAILKLTDAGQPLDKKKIFVKVYDEAWTLNRDYLIRNLFRLLSDEVESFLLTQNTDTQLNLLQRLFLLRRMSAAQQHSSFREEFNVLYAAAQNANDLATQANLLTIYSGHIINSIPDGSFKKSDAAEVFFTEHELLLRQHKYRLEELQLRYAAAERKARENGIEFSAFIPVTQEQSSDPIINYFRTHAAVYRLHGIAQMQKAADALQLLETINSPLINQNSNALELMRLMAGGYEDAGESVAAAALYEQMTKMPGFENAPYEATIFSNYTTCLIHLEKYIQVAESIDQRDQQGKANTQLLLRRALCLLLANRSKDAEKLVQQLEITLGNHHTDLTIIQLCLLLHINEQNLASELIKNLMQSRSYKKTSSDTQQMILDFIRRTLKTALTDKNARQILRTEIDALLTPEKIVELLPLVWLRQYLNTAIIIPLRKF